MSENIFTSATTSPRPTPKVSETKPSRKPVDIKPTRAQASAAIDTATVAKDFLMGAALGAFWPVTLPGLLLLACETPNGIGTKGFETLELDSAVLELNMSLQRGETVLQASYVTGDKVLPYDLKEGTIWGRIMFDNSAPFQNDAALIPEGIPKKDVDGFPMAEDCDVEEGSADYLGYCSYRGFTTVDSEAVDPIGNPVRGSIYVRSNGDLVTRYTYTEFVTDPETDIRTTESHEYYFYVDDVTGEVQCGSDNVCDEYDQVGLGLEEPSLIPYAFYRTNANGELKEDDNGLPVQFLQDENLRDINADQRCWALLSASAPDDDGEMQIIDQERLINEAFLQDEPLGEEGLRAESVKLQDVFITIIDKSGRNINPEVIPLGELTATVNSDEAVIENFTFQIPPRFYHPEAETEDGNEGPKDLHYNIEIIVEGRAARASQGGLFPTYLYGGSVKLVFELSEDDKMPPIKDYSDTEPVESTDGEDGGIVEDASDAGVEEDLSETDAIGEDM